MYFNMYLDITFLHLNVYLDVNECVFEEAVY